MVLMVSFCPEEIRSLKMFLLLLCIIGGSFAAPLQSDDLWNTYKQVFGKNYSSSEDAARRALWENTVARVHRHNLEYDLGLRSFRLAVNAMADKVPQEYLGFNSFLTKKVNRSRTLFMAPANVEYPEHIDWRDEGLVTEVRDQKKCGSCWAFSSTGALEGQHKRKTGQLVLLSVQNLVDCAKEGNHGCAGGNMDFAFEYIQEHGIDTEESYPYKAKDGLCGFSKENIGANLTGYVDIDEENEEDLLKAVATVGPVSVAINSGSFEFVHYSNGVYDARRCKRNKLNHAVLIVGYGSEGGKPYWIVKNSWGPLWGENGYVRMARNKNLCGIANMASYPLV